MGEAAPPPGGPRLALRAERAPNATGAELLGYSRDYAAALKAAESAAVVLVLDEPEITVRPAGMLLYAGTVLPDDPSPAPPAPAPAAPRAPRRADVVLPIASVAEEDGTFVNREARVQRYFQAKPAPGRSEEHTSELQSHSDLVCRLLLEKKKKESTA